MSVKYKNFNSQLENAISNITKDRETTEDLLKDLMKYMSISPDRHAEVGTIAAKYVETLQRSNEQLVKIVSLLQKKESTSQGLSEDEKEEIFDLIKGT